MAKETLTFLPYLKRQPAFTVESDGVGNLITRLSLNIVHDENVTPVELPAIALRGPGDVIGISESMIARREPVPNTVDFEPNYFPFIEFMDPDFLWRYSLTPLKNGEESKAEPWLSLIVLSDDEMVEMAEESIEAIAPLNGKQLFLSVRTKYLPDPNLSWANAHVQLSGLTGSIGPFIENNPSAHCSRIFCMRKLQPEKRYVAFLVPNYAAAVQAAFGLSTADTTDAKAWSSENSDAVVKLPIYSHWTFNTSEQGDFETLARALQSFNLADSKVGTQAVDANIPLPGQDTLPEKNMSHFFQREGALAPPGFENKRVLYENESRHLPYTDVMLGSLNESLKTRTTQQEINKEDNNAAADPLISLRVYGRYFRKTSKIEMPPPASPDWPGISPWVNEMNLDFRYRVTGGFGTAVVQQGQEEYMRKCWAQVGEIQRANEALRRYQTALKLSERIKIRHIDPLSEERFAMLTAPFHAHYQITQGAEKKNLALALQQSGIAPGGFSSQLRRIAHRRVQINNTKPIKSFENKLQKTVMAAQSSASSKSSVHQLSAISSEKEIELLQSFKNKIQTIAPRPVTPPSSAKSLSSRAKSANTSPTGVPSATSGPKVPFSQITESISIQTVDTGASFRAIFDVKKSLLASLSFRLKLPGNVNIPENLDPIMMAPRIKEAMCRPLISLNKDYILPGIENLQNNGVTLCEENRRFIESYLVGCNHEMGRELAWRHFPTDQRGTVFSYFWDAVQSVNPPEDIRDIHIWNQVLGKNKSGLSSSPNLVLLIKGDLIRRYPSTIIYAIKIPKTGSKPRYWSDAYPGKNPPINKDIMIEPIFRAQVGEDTLCVGFPFTGDDVQGSNRDGEYYFVLQENQDLPRFGLDTISARIKNNKDCLTPEQATELIDNDPQWGDAPLDHAGYISNIDFLTSDEGAAASSATIADKTYQLPIRIAIHSSELLPEI
jgi:hypothetical protein